jgi:hypothetical protein
VVLLVEHQAERLAAFDHGGGAVAAGGVFAGNEVALDEHLFLHRIERSPSSWEKASFMIGRPRRPGASARARRRVGRVWPSRERVAAQVAGEADARGEHGAVLPCPPVIQSAGFLTRVEKRIMGS